MIQQRKNFYPRSPCGERQAANGLADAPPEISIHALLAESDCRKIVAGLRSHTHFYPRSPCGERLPLDEFQDLAPDISIHALLAESDARSLLNSPNSQISIHALLAESDIISLMIIFEELNFYPRSPCGERQGTMVAPIAPTYISIHALLAESDLSSSFF